MKIKVEQFEGRNGVVKNQFIITTPESTFFQSYNSIIVRKDNDNKVSLVTNIKEEYSKQKNKILSDWDIFSKVDELRLRPKNLLNPQYFYLIVT